MKLYKLIGHFKSTGKDLSQTVSLSPGDSSTFQHDNDDEDDDHRGHVRNF